MKFIGYSKCTVHSFDARWCHLGANIHQITLLAMGNIHVVLELYPVVLLRGKRYSLGRARPHRRVCCGYFSLSIYIVRRAVSHFRFLFCAFLRHSYNYSPTTSIHVIMYVYLVSCHAQTTPLEETVWWTKSNFLGLLLECGKDQWDCNIVNYYVAHTLLTSCNARRRKIVFQFQLLTW